MNDINKGLYSYFTSRDIKILNHSFENINKLSSDDIKMQINNIINFQNKFKGYRDNLLPRINGSIGKELESYKVQVKNLELHLEYINKKIDKNAIDIFLLEEGSEILSKAKDSIIYVENNNYKSLIKRSMYNYEVCLGRTNEENLRLGEEGNIEIGTIKYLTYNLVEQDAYVYFRYLKKKNYNENMLDLIEYFTSESLLEDDSVEYLKGLMSYPMESLKLWDKYRKNKKKLIEEEYLDALYKAKSNDGNSLMI